jgi:hypothetical protein
MSVKRSLEDVLQAAWRSLSEDQPRRAALLQTAA